MKLGLIARADDRGLGILTWEVYRHLHPERVLVVREPVAEARGFPPHLDRYPDGTAVTYDGGLDEATVRGWLDGLEVVYSAETFYDGRLIGWARAAGVATVLHVMPEFFPAVDHPEPDALWVPTTWRTADLPSRARLVPVPVATDRFDQDTPDGDGPLRVLHVAGHRAAMDRNGTQVVLRAVRLLRAAVALTITGQDGRLPAVRTSRGGGVTVTSRPRGTVGYWELYDGQDLLVLPRRYGGLCLPVQEALAAGLVPVLPDVSPNGDWPAVLVPASTSGQFTTAAGDLPLAQVEPRDLAATIDQLATDRCLLGTYRRLAGEWARASSWDALTGLWLDELDRAR